MRQPDFELTPPERELLATIKLNPLGLSGYEDDTRNGNAVYQLMKLLLARPSIPLPRVKFFGDPSYNIGGRGKSRQSYFERNGCKGNEIFRHPHFLEYLKYFLYGPDLPPPVI